MRLLLILGHLLIVGCTADQHATDVSASASSELIDIIRHDVEPDGPPSSFGKKIGLVSMKAAPTAQVHVPWIWRLSPAIVLTMIAIVRLAKWNRQGSISAALWQMISQGSQICLACAIYFLSGPALIILNKYVMTTLGFPYPITVANLGLLSMLVTTQLLVRSGFWPLKQTEVDAKVYMHTVLPLAVFGSLSLVLGNWVYLYLSVPLIQILKSFTVIYVMLLGFFFGVENFTMQLVFAVVTIIVGLTVSISHDIDFTHSSHMSGAFLFGLLVMTSANLSEAGRSVFTQISVERFAFMDSVFHCTPSMVILNSLLVVIFEIRSLIHEPYSWRLLGCLALASILGGITNFANFWLTKLVGSLSMKIMVNARNILLILFSVIAFGESCTTMQYIGYSIALAGLAIYDDAKRSAESTEQEKLKLTTGPTVKV
jgi:drug/metabolite transporter (DMT)-like permease